VARLLPQSVSTELLERAAPLRHALDTVARARLGHGGTLVVAGEAGIGKSALVRQCLACLQPADRVLVGNCEDLASARPLGPLRDIVHAQRWSALDALLRDGASADAIFASFVEHVGAAPGTAVIVFEDIHWADQATLDLVRYLARRIAALPIVLTVTLRADEAVAGHPLRALLDDLPPWSVTTLTLPPLSVDAVAELARRAQRPAGGLHEATAGNPFFVTEVLASGVVDPAQGVPSTVRDAVHGRLERLGAAQRDALEALCVVPGRVERTLADALLPNGAQAIDDCVQRGVLVADADAGTLAFRHELARRALADALPAAHRQARHAQVLAALTRWVAAPQQGGGGAAVSLSRLAHHAAAAGDASRLLDLAPRAAAEAAQLGAHRQAALQLGAALRHADAAPSALRAQLFESWSYEAGLALGIDAAVIDARHQAIALWQALGRPDKVGLNLRWLSRLHWYQGHAELAERYATQAVQTLEPLPAGPELAWAYSVRSQFYMLQDRTNLAVEWGARALALAQRLGQAEIACHALNNIGTAELFAGRPGGQDKLEQSLTIALDGGFHEQAARVYTNMSEHAVVFKDYARAERWLAEGIAFDRAHDLDAWTYYLVGWQAQLRLEQGRFDEAERIAREVLAMPRLTAVMRLPALTVLARVRMRRGEADALRLIDEALAIALPTGEVQRIAPLACAKAEAAWLRGDAAACAAALEPLVRQAGAGVNAWEAGEVAVWRQRAGQSAVPTIPPHAAAPWRLELEGDPVAAAHAWLALGAPNEAALALLQAALCGPRERAAAPLTQALSMSQRIGATTAVARMRGLAAQWGLQCESPRGVETGGARPRANGHPQGLSARQQQVLAHLAQGLNDAEIALRLGVARRTAEHHVAAILGKLSVANRAEAVTAARQRGLLPAHTK
jgi:DNA-binding CsgD family transcriptional regulator